MGLGFMCYQSAGVEWLLQGWITELASLLFFIASCAMLIMQKETRKEEPNNLYLLTAFIVGLALFLTNLLNEWDHLTWMLLLSALFCGTFSVYAGSMLTKET